MVRTPAPTRTGHIGAGANSGPVPRRAVATRDGRTYQLFFLCGHPRSGTNWIGALLNLHPDINCQGEFYFDRLRLGYEGLWSKAWLVAHDPPVRQVAEECFKDSVRRIMLAVADRRPGARIIGDRSPSRVHGLLDDADHIVAVRDGRDVIVSWTHHLLRARGPIFQRHHARGHMQGVLDAFRRDPKAFHKQPHLLLSVEPWVRDLARTWAAHVTHDAAAAADMNAGRRSGRALVVRYEDIHRDLDSSRRRMYEFLGVDPAAAAAPSAESRTAAGHGRDDPRSFFRKGEVGDWRRYFTPDATRWFNEEAGEALAAQGYTPERAP